MPIFLYSVGAVVAAIGAAMIAFGIPNNEFGIGNTLIVAGTTAVTGGLIVVALGVAVAQLQRVVEALATRAPVRSSRPFDTFDPAAGRPSAAPARVPFPTKTRAEARAEARAEMPPPPAPSPVSQHADRPVEDVAPALPNPDEPPVTVADEAQLSPLHLSFPRAEAEAESAAPAPDRDEHVPPPPRKPKTYFDAMWPAQTKSPEPPKLPETLAAEPEPAESTPAEPKEPEFQWSDVRRGEPNVAEPQADDRPDEDAAPRTVAILKSGVVDGMGYTLYVDGSIEAELPQGTLRFASINELRSHLEKTS